MIKNKKDEINNVKVGTVIGSTRFEDEMKDMARKLQSYGYLSLITSIGKEPTYPVSENLLMKEGYKRLDLSDFTVCINKDGYIGENTAREIYYATFIKRIPVIFEYDMITEKMLKYINAFIISSSNKFHLLNTDALERGYQIKKIYIRDNVKISEDIKDMIPNYDSELLSAMISLDMRKQLRDMEIPVVMLNDNRFESIMRESSLYYPVEEEKQS